MGELVLKSWVGQRAYSRPVEFAVDPTEYGRIGVIYEQLLDDDFSQTAYLAYDLLRYNAILPETNERASNELVGMALEKLGKPFRTEFHYRNSPDGLRAENGELLRALNERGLQRAMNDAKKDPQLQFIVERRKADLGLVSYIENDMQVGETVLVGSACPSAEELGVAQEVLEAAHYQPELDQAMNWLITKTETGVTWKTINLFHASPEILAQTYAAVAGRPVAVVSREESPWYKIPITNTGDDIDQRIIDTFDQIISARCGQVTFHGLTEAERESQATTSAETLIEDDSFQTMLLATQELLSTVAYSLVRGQSYVPAQYLEKMLAMQKPNGEHELVGTQRKIVMKLRNNVANPNEFTDALQLVHTAACSGLWATIDQLYHQQVGGSEGILGSSSVDMVVSGLENVEVSRAAGHTEFGCPGDSSPAQSTSIFEMDQQGILGVLFGRKVIRTNCPKCDTKDVDAVIAHGTITCKTCDACVDVCTGRTLRSARLKKRAKKVGSQVWSFFQKPPKTKPKQEFRLFESSRSKKKSQKRRRVLANRTPG